MKDNYGWLDLLPPGWVNLAREMIYKIEAIDPSFKIYDMKEKYGYIDVYGYPYNDDIDDIIHKYSYLSSCTCFQCGKPATKYSTGYVLPFCEKCAKKNPQYKYREIVK